MNKLVAYQRCFGRFSMSYHGEFQRSFSNFKQRSPSEIRDKEHVFESQDTYAQEESLSDDETSTGSFRSPFNYKFLSRDRRFADEVRLKVQGGNGGDGCISFRREKCIPFGGPDGGDGGRGGSVILSASTEHTSLHHVPSLLKAKDGKGGKGKHCYGRDADDLVFKIPLGTVVKQLPIDALSAPCAANEAITLYDMKEEGNTVLVARGAKGGLGNVHFANAVDRVPRKSTPGEKAEWKILSLELKTIADVGLVGLPNAGKSTFLSAVSNAHPKIAPYPFTTLNPFLGTIDYQDYYQVTVADIPGLVPGAHLNIGLGHQFLRHIERAKMLVYILDMFSEEDTYMVKAETIKTTPLSSLYPQLTEKRTPWNDLSCLQKELEFYHSTMTNRPSLIVANKMDMGKRAEMHLEELKTRTTIPIIPISAKNMHRIEDVTQFIRTTVESLKVSG